MDAEMIDDDDPDRNPVTVEPFADRPDGAADTDAGADDDAASDRSPDDAELAAAAMTHDIEALVSERDQFKDIALRLQADFDNYRKRVAAQQVEAVERGTGRLAEAMLPVLDAFEAAFVVHPKEIEPLFNLLLGELRKQGLEVIDLQDRPFDPEVADAVMHEPGDAGEPVVSEVLRSGYLWKGRVLRPAMVKVKG